MARYVLRVLETVRRCPDVVSLRLARPEEYSFVAGQYLLLTLKTAEGALTKPFTHSSSPHDPYLEITTRLSGSVFKKTLETLGREDTVHVTGPAGRFAVPDGESRVAFLVGGVGITPAISMLRWWSEQGAGPDDPVLFYGNRDVGCVPFADELLALEDAGSLRRILVFEATDKEWSGERGFITAEVVQRHLDPVAQWLFVVAGPPAMVDAMERVLDALDVPAGRRLVERFSTSARPEYPGEACEAGRGI